MDQAFQTIPLKQLKEHPANPRQHFDEHRLDELASSIKDKGILNPLLVRPQGSAFEILAGARRFRAAKKAGLLEAPAIVRTLDDEAAFELMLVDNLQREDVHPLEEGAGYNALMLKAGYTVERIAERVGRSVKYVYDRVKLLQLTKEAHALFLENRITAGHAILLARLKPEDQERAIDPADGGCFTGEHLLWNPDEDGKKKPGPWDDLKAVSVRELDAWIAEHVRFEPTRDADPMLFPDTALRLQEAQQSPKKVKVIAITHDHFVQEEARSDDERTWGPKSWKRADGRSKSKICEYSVLGVVAAGVGRGEAYDVCTAKEKCKTHWGEWQREREKRAKQSATTGARAAKDRWQKEEERRKREQAHEEAARARWKKATPSILKAVAEKVRKAPAGAKGPLAQIILGEISDRGWGAKPDVDGYVPRGSSAEDLVRYAAFKVLAIEATNEYHAPREFPKRAKAFGVDVEKILDEVAPAEKAAAVVARCRECGCTEDKACDTGLGEGCSWAEQPNKKTGLGLCTACRAKQKAKNPKVKGAPRAQASA